MNTPLVIGPKRAFPRWLVRLMGLLASIGALAQPGSLDPTFTTGPAFLSVTKLATQADGKILIAGTFTNYLGTKANGLLRLGTNGTPDAAFNMGTGFTGQKLIIPGVFTNINPPQFYGVVPTAQGILVGGIFESYNGVGRTNLARLQLATGALDTAFATRVDGSVLAVAVQANGKVLVGGAFKNVNGVARIGLARLNVDGTLDTTFNPVWGTVVAPGPRVLAVQADGKILVGGGHLALNGFTLVTKAMVRLNADGTTDATFQVPVLKFTTESVTTMLVQTDGKIVIGGLFATLNDTPHKAIARLNANGSVDTTWPGTGVGPNGLESVTAIVAAPGNQMYVGGKFETLNGIGPDGIARLNADGSRDGTFKKPAGSTTFWTDAVAVQTDGKVLVAGTFTLGTTTESTKTVMRLISAGAVVIPPPTITTPPAGQAFVLNATGKSISVVAAGTPPLSYQWYKDDVALAFRTEASLPFSQFREADAGNYRVVVTNPGGSVTSVVATLTVILPPRITTPPANLTVAPGEPGILNVGVEGTAPFTYQWRKNAQPIAKATNATFLIAAAALADAGNYSVAVTNAAGGVLSGDAVVAVRLLPPSIARQPEGQVVTLADTNLTAKIMAGRRLRLTVLGALPPWINKGVYEITFTETGYSSPAGGALATASNGGYGVGVGTAPPAALIDFANFFPTGQSARLTLVPDGILEFNRADLVEDQNGRWEWVPAILPSGGPKVTLSVAATGSGTLAYQWRRNGIALPGQTSATLVLDNIQRSNLGDYSVEVSNAGGKVVSGVASITAGGTAPAITRQPQAQSITEGGTIHLAVQAAGSEPISYAWEKVGAGFVPGGTGASLMLPNAKPEAGGTYQVTVRNSLGAVTSEAVTVAVCATGAPATFLGRPWVKVAETGMTVPGTANRFGPWSEYYKPRLTLRDKTLHFSARAGETLFEIPGFGTQEAPQRAVLRWRAGRLDTLVYTNTPTPDGDRFSDVLYVTDETDGAVSFGGSSRGGMFTGLYEIRGGTIRKLADQNSTRPGGAGTFAGFGSVVRRNSTVIWGSAIATAAGLNGGGIYKLEGGRITALIDEAGNLPGVVNGFGGMPSNFGLAYDGVTAALACASADLVANAAGAFRFDVTGAAVALASTADTIPGAAPQKFQNFSALDVEGGPVFFVANDEVYAVAGSGPVIRLNLKGTSLSAAGGDLVYVASGSTVVRRAAATTRDEAVLPANAVLDCRKVARVWQVDAQGDDVTIGVDFSDGTSAVFVNLGEGGGPAQPVTLSAPTYAAGRVQFGIPTVAGRTYEIQFQPGIGNGNWSTIQTLTGDGSVKPVTVPANGVAGIVRVGQK